MSLVGPVGLVIGVRTSCETRFDGWPKCPNCGEDELWSDDFMHWSDGPRPTFPPSRGFDEFGCYLCRWNGVIEWAEIQ